MHLFSFRIIPGPPRLATAICGARSLVKIFFRKFIIKSWSLGLLLHRLAVRISLPFHIFLQVVIVMIQVYNWKIRHHSLVCRSGLDDFLYWYFHSARKEKREKEKVCSSTKEYIWLRKKVFFKSFAKQTGTFSVLNFTTSRVGKLRTLKPNWEFSKIISTMRYIEKAGISCIMRMYLACKSKHITKIIGK